MGSAGSLELHAVVALHAAGVAGVVLLCGCKFPPRTTFGVVSDLSGIRFTTCSCTTAVVERPANRAGEIFD